MSDALNVSPGSATRSQVGIGTLIVFIAMVLVASIAAGVLIETAGLLQTQSEDTGQESQSRVTNRLQTVTAVGHVDTGSETETTTSVNRDYVIIESENPYYDDRLELEADFETFSLGMGTQTNCDTDPQYYLVIGGDRYERAFGSGIDANTIGVNRYQTDAGDYKIEFVDEERGDGGYVMARVDSGASVDVELADPDNCDALDVKLSHGSSTILIDTNTYTGTARWKETTESKTVEAPPRIETVELTATLAPGSEPVDFADTTITYVGGGTTAHLTYTDGTADAESFTVQPITGSGSELRDSSDRTTIRLDVAAIDPAGNGIEAGETVTLGLVTRAGARTTIRLRAPETLADGNVVRVS